MENHEEAFQETGGETLFPPEREEAGPLFPSPRGLDGGPKKSL